MLRFRSRIGGTEHQLAVLDVGLEEDSPGLFRVAVALPASGTSGYRGGKGIYLGSIVQNEPFMVMIERAVEVLHIHPGSQSDLLLVGETGSLTCFFPCLGEDRE